MEESNSYVFENGQFVPYGGETVQTPAKEEVSVDIEESIEANETQEGHNDDQTQNTLGQNTGQVTDTNVSEPLPQEEAEPKDDIGVGQSGSTEPNPNTDNSISEDSVEEDEVVETDDIFQYISEKMKSTGLIPEDFDFGEDVADEQAKADKIYETYVDNLKPKAREELLEEFKNELNEYGYDERTLSIANQLKNGVPEKDIAVAQDYISLSSIKVDDLDENQAEDYVRKMYIDRGLKDNEISKIIEDATDDEMQELLSQTSSYFSSKGKEQEDQNKKIAEQNKAYQQQLLAHRQQVLSTVFNQKQIGNDKLTDDQLDKLYSAIYDKNIPVKDQEGRIVNVAMWDQFQYALQNDFALQLYSFQKYLFSQDQIERAKAQGEIVGENKSAVRWAKRSNSKSNTPNKSKRKSDPNASQFVYEDGQYKKLE